MELSQIQKAVKHLHAAGVVAHPTETCYGFAADIFQRAAIERLYDLKQMPLTKPVSVLVRDLEEAQRYGEFSDRALELAKQYWPGPLTLIVPRTSMLPRWVNPGLDSVGFRMSPHAKSAALVEAFGGPLTTTSANVHGKPQAYNVQEMLDQGLLPDFVLDGGQLAGDLPSTIVKVVGNDIELIRQGPVQLD